MAWLLLFIAGLLEVVWATTLKLSDGFTRPVPAAITMVAAGVSFWMLSLAMRSLPLGLAYATWVGIGAVGAVILGVIWFGEALTPLRLGSVALIVAGIAGLSLSNT